MNAHKILALAGLMTFALPALADNLNSPGPYETMPGITTGNPNFPSYSGTFAGNGGALTNLNAAFRAVQVVVSGDSIFSTNNSEELTNTWANSTIPFFKMLYGVTNPLIIGVPGQTIYWMSTNYPAREHVIAQNGLQNILIADGGLNDLNTSNDITTELNFSNYWTQAGEDGYFRVACTIPYVGSGISAYSTNINNWIIAQTNLYEVLVRYDLFSGGIPTVDGIHPNAAGSHQLASLVAQSIYNYMSQSSSNLYANGLIDAGNAYVGGNATIGNSVEIKGDGLQCDGVNGSFFFVMKSASGGTEWVEYYNYSGQPGAAIGYYPGGSIGNAPANSILFCNAVNSFGNGQPSGWIDQNANLTMTNNITAYGYFSGNGQEAAILGKISNSTSYTPVYAHITNGVATYTTTP